MADNTYLDVEQHIRETELYLQQEATRFQPGKHQLFVSVFFEHLSDDHDGKFISDFNIPASNW
jgi:hypothetical protein